MVRIDDLNGWLNSTPDPGRRSRTAETGRRSSVGAAGEVCLGSMLQDPRLLHVYGRR